jgi:ankyrin repeat protein
LFLASKQVKNSLYLILLFCSGMYLAKAMEQEEPVPKIRKIEGQAGPLSSLAVREASSWATLPKEIKNYIISFLESEENAQEAIKNIKYLATTSKEFYNLINNPRVLGTLIQGISKRFNISFIDVALKFKNAGAADWLKGSIEQQYPQEKEIVNQLLVKATKEGDKNLIIFLLNAGADVNAQDDYGDTPIFNYRYTPLYYAAGLGNKDIVELLLNASADVNKEDRLGWTPLHRVTGLGNKDTIELLLKYKADVNKATREGYTPLLIAIANDNKDIAELLLNAGAGVNQGSAADETPLTQAIKEGNKDIVKLLLQRGADVNQANKYDIIPLHCAVLTRNKDIVELLLKYKADVNKATVHGETPLSKAISGGQKDIVELLLEHGAHN